MNLELNYEQALELDALVSAALRDMSHEIAATENGHYRAQLMGRRGLLQQLEVDLHDRVQPGPSQSAPPANSWTVEIVFSEDDRRTRADARLRTTPGWGGWHGWGLALRRRADPDVPAIGEELAAARALLDLSHRLLDTAARAIEGFEGHPVHVDA